MRERKREREKNGKDRKVAAHALHVHPRLGMAKRDLARSGGGSASGQRSSRSRSYWRLELGHASASLSWKVEQNETRGGRLELEVEGDEAVLVAEWKEKVEWKLGAERMPRGGSRRRVGAEGRSSRWKATRLCREGGGRSHEKGGLGRPAKSRERSRREGGERAKAGDGRLLGEGGGMSHREGGLGRSIRSCGRSRREEAGGRIMAAGAIKVASRAEERGERSPGEGGGRSRESLR